MPFSAEWLALREPVDHAARSRALVATLAAHLPNTPALAIIDLACGTGSNCRYLIDVLPAGQRWLLVDHDRDLLAAAEKVTSEVATRAMDLRDIFDADILRGRSLVTASALLDLVSEEWLHRLVHDCATHRAAVLFALIYDGRIECTPAEPEDALVRDLVNQHQRRDKGFGPALGPSATDVAERLLLSNGYALGRERSDWLLDARCNALQEAFLAGLADAALDMSPEQAARIRAWHARRLEHVRTSQSRIVVGHQDLAGWPEL